MGRLGAGELPLAVVEEVRKAELKGYETNRCKLEVELRGCEGVAWRVEIRAERRRG